MPCLSPCDFNSGLPLHTSEAYFGMKSPFVMNLCRPSQVICVDRIAHAMNFPSGGMNAAEIMTKCESRLL